MSTAPTMIKYRGQIYKLAFRTAEDDWPPPWVKISANAYQYTGKRAVVIARQAKVGWDLMATGGGVTFYNARRLQGSEWNLQHLGEFLGRQGPWLGY